MHHHENLENQHRRTTPSGSFWGSRTFWVFLGFLAVALTMLVSEHRAHFLGALPLLLLVVICPLMHMFGHAGHGSQSEGRINPPQERNGGKS